MFLLCWESFRQQDQATPEVESLGWLFTPNIPFPRGSGKGWYPLIVLCCYFWSSSTRRANSVFCSNLKGVYLKIKWSWQVGVVGRAALMWGEGEEARKQGNGQRGGALGTGQTAHSPRLPELVLSLSGLSWSHRSAHPILAPFSTSAAREFHNLPRVPWSQKSILWMVIGWRMPKQSLNSMKDLIAWHYVDQILWLLMNFFHI